MNTNQTFCFEAQNNQKYYYDINDDGLTYRSSDTEEISINWEDIDFLKDSPYKRVDVHFQNMEYPIPIYYDTGRFETLLKAMCDKLADIHSRNLPSREFKASLGYFIHIIVAISFSSLIIIFGIENNSKLLLAASILFLFLAIHLMRRPLSISFSDENFIIRNLFFKKIFRYSDIKGLDFSLTGHEYSTYLVINIHLKNGKKLKIQRFNDITLCYIYLVSRYKSFLT